MPAQCEDSQSHHCILASRLRRRGRELTRELLEVLPGCSISLEEEASGKVESRCPPYCEDPPESWFDLLVCASECVRAHAYMGESVCVCVCYLLIPLSVKRLTSVITQLLGSHGLMMQL